MDLKEDPKERAEQIEAFLFGPKITSQEAVKEYNKFCKYYDQVIHVSKTIILHFCGGGGVWEGNVVVSVHMFTGGVCSGPIASFNSPVLLPLAFCRPLPIQLHQGIYWQAGDWISTTEIDVCIVCDFH